MNILGLIPARGGSKGIPNKNIKLLDGKPLLEYTFFSVESSRHLTKTILSSDNDEIIALAEKIGIEVPFKRPHYLAEDSSPTLGVIIHALEYFKNKKIYFDAVCLLQATTPFREEGFIDRAIEKFIAQDLDALVSVLEVPDEYNPHWTFTVNEEDELLLATNDDKIISRRQELPKAYHRDGAIYLTKSKVILNQKSLYGEKLGYIVSNPKYYVNIDTMKDWEKAVVLAQELKL